MLVALIIPYCIIYYVSPSFSEGGAGTWSDGKLTTRIGKNSEDVRYD